MAPLVGTVRHGDDSVLGLVDLTKAARCALGGVHRCRSNEVQVHKGSNAPQSCWGSISYVKVQGLNVVEPLALSVGVVSETLSGS